MLRGWVLLALPLLVASAGSTVASGSEGAGSSRPVVTQEPSHLALKSPFHYEKSSAGLREVGEGHSRMNMDEDTRPLRYLRHSFLHKNLETTSAPSRDRTESPSASHQRRGTSRANHALANHARFRYREARPETQVSDQDQLPPFKVYPEVQEPSATDDHTAQMLSEQSMQQQMLQQAAHQHSRWGTQEQELLGIGKHFYMKPQLQPTKSHATVILDNSEMIELMRKHHNS
ncbi:hypothetical protein FA10DRAFT_258720 [Acaromyces ingoldii]|uniref:Uncharacterized protein n=1 Tax=Acaromyces ingoldii TaxID=215250 RepID=A0A316YTG2_9BASI|nr:hypothetical protein FA10DRAFT_258720 [Acaromyces ingoldii]PWN91313.1 hypothetical protein FA10DRAFT_258720 [Acaromyces ingoldii]